MRRACFIILAAGFIGGLVVAPPHNAVSACSIGVVPGPLPTPTRDERRAYAANAFGRADAVFRGRVIAVGGVGPEAITFQTDQWWKGMPAATVTVQAVANGCGYWLKMGDEYIVYAYTTTDGFGATLEVTPGTASHPVPTTDVEDEVFGQGTPYAPTGAVMPRLGGWFGLLLGGVFGIAGAGVVAVLRR